ncbi:hypothetical protein [Mesorhizobium sp.]|uniref:hypothetical protein n=1 Tax=Mesorhizobium sp. TaxID=1871066 RepID=UPI002580A376|nr:hypothetical protein [Mesorhizobium sp.]
MHSSLAVTLTGTPLGLTAANFWTRTKFKGTLALKRHINPTRVPIETKESYRWLENLRQSIALVGAPERCVHVGDRESSIAPRRALVPAPSCGCRRTGWQSGLPMLPHTILLIASLPNLRRRLGRDVIALRSIRTRRPGCR